MSQCCGCLSRCLAFSAAVVNTLATLAAHVPIYAGVTMTVFILDI